MVETELEIAVRKENEDPEENAADFYEVFLNSEIHVPGISADGDDYAADGDKLQLEVYEHEGNEFIYMFDTKARVTEFYDQEKNVVTMLGYDWLNGLQQGKTILVLNPKSTSERMFAPDEIEWLLSNVGVEPQE